MTDRLVSALIAAAAEEPCDLVLQRLLQNQPGTEPPDRLDRARKPVPRMSPQVSNRDALLEGALRCLEELGYGEVTTRDIAQAAKANVASITYHFGSKDTLIAEALAEVFDVGWQSSPAR